MAILRSKEGHFYNVPDDRLHEFKIEPEKLKEALKEEGHLEGPPKKKKGPPPPPLIMVPARVPRVPLTSIFSWEARKKDHRQQQ